MVRKNDKERRKFVEHYFDQEVEGISVFDIVLNTMTLHVDKICNIIHLVVKGKKSTG